MSRALFAARALAEAGWRAEWNRRWRFSRVKLGFWMLLGQVGFAALAVWRLGAARVPAATGAGAGGAGMAALVAPLLFTVATWSFATAFVQGRERLFTGPALPLVQISPAPGQGALLALVAGGLPRRAWSAVLWATGAGVAAAPAERVWLVPLMWGGLLVAGALGELAGLLVLVAWVRLAPRGVAAAWAALLGLQMALVWYCIYLVATGVSLESLAAAARGLGGAVMTGIAVLLGVPGLLMLGWLALAPGRFADAYREGWLALRELSEGRSRQRHSRWPAPTPGAAGAIAAREWLQMLRNKMTLLRLGLWAAALAAIFTAAPWLRGLAAGGHDLLVLGTGVGLTAGLFAELAAAVGASDGPNLALLVAAGVRPGRVLAGKLLASAPFALLAALTAWAVAFALGDGAGAQMRAAAVAGLIGAGMALIMTGISLVDGALAEPGSEQRTEAEAALLEQVPTGPWGMAGLVASFAYGAAAVWLAQNRAGWLTGAVPIATAALFPGYLRLKRLLTHGE